MCAELNRKAFENLSYGLYIVTSRNEDRLNGQIVNTVIQVTSEPARIAVIINKKNLTHEYVSQSQLFGVSVLEEAAPLAFFGPFGFRSGRDYDKLSKVQYKEAIILENHLRSASNRLATFLNGNDSHKPKKEIRR